MPAGKTGTLAVKLPLPPGSLVTLLNNPARFQKAYLDEFPGFYSMSDEGVADAEGFISVMARTDDVINVAGHRLTTSGMEEVLYKHPEVAEAAVIGVDDAMKGTVPVGLLVLNAGSAVAEAQVVRECVQLMRDRVGAVASFRAAAVVPRLPKTRSGKILRATMKSIANGVAYKVPATIDDPGALDDVTKALARLGFTRPADAARPPAR